MLIRTAGPGEKFAAHRGPKRSKPAARINIRGDTQRDGYGDAGLGDGPTYLRRARPWCTEDVWPDEFAGHARERLDGDDVMRRNARPVAYSLRSDAPAHGSDGGKSVPLD